MFCDIIHEERERRREMTSWRRNRTTLMRRASMAVWASLVLLIALAPSLSAAKIQCEWDGVKNIVAVADIHGDYDNLVAILRGVKLIDEDLDWIGGKTHFVQLGDVLDRGDDGRDALDLLMKLEKQAEKAGGKVHMLLGNHEEVNIAGAVFDTPGYVTVEQFKDFLPDKTKEKLEKEFKKDYEKQSGGDGAYEEKLREFWDQKLAETQKADDPNRLDYIRYFYSNYGKWLLTKNIAIRINDIIFVHGGFSDDEDYLKSSLTALNNAARREYKALVDYWIFKMPPPSEFLYLYQPNAPQWYRGHVRFPEQAFKDRAERILGRLKANYMVIGHTVRSSEDIKSRKLDRFDGRVWAIDVGISDYYNDLLCALVIDCAAGEGDHTFEVWWGDDEN